MVGQNTLFKSLYFLYIIMTQKAGPYRNVQFFIWSKSDILYLDTFKYSLHNFRETINLSITFTYCVSFKIHNQH